MKNQTMPKKVKKRKSSGWGGARPGAGRKKDPKNVGLQEHVARPVYRSGARVHVVLLTSEGAPSLRDDRIHPIVVAEIARASAKGFRVLESKVLHDRLMLLVTADDGSALSRGMQRIGSRIALQVNPLTRRRGKLWKERYAFAKR